jgi:Bifunctional DNA primase/polymerase, N-terminal
MRAAARSGELTDAAAALVIAGIPVFPCVPRRKQPLTPHGFHDATADVDQVRQWWRRTPQANIGMPTGAASGVVVVDVDVHDGGTGFPAFDQARAAGLLARWGWLVRTPSGGLHAYFRSDTAGAAVPRSWQVPSRHIDFRGEGGYVVVPPSRCLSGDGRVRSYTVIAVAHHRPSPLDADALRAFLDPPRPHLPPPTAPVVGSRPDTLAAWVASRPEGARNQGLFWAACRLAESGHSIQSALGVLGDAARSAGLSQREVEATIRSAHRITARLSTGSSPGPPSAADPIGL